MWKFFIASIILLLTGAAGVMGFVEGRVVDKKGASVSGAEVYLYDAYRRSPDDQRPSLDNIVIHVKADASGRFQFVAEMQRFLLCSTYPSDPRVFSPLPVNFRCSDRNSKLVEVGKGGNADLGDVPVSFNNQETEIRLRSADGSPFLDRSFSHIWLKISDANFFPIATRKIELSSADQQSSSIRLNLPEGALRLEFSPGDAQPAAWGRAGILTIPGEHSWQPYAATLTIQGAGAENSLSPEQAKAELKKMMIDYSLGSFLQTASGGNEKAVQLFLDSNFDLNQLSKNKSNVLMAATDYPNIVKMLLERKINVNQRTDEGFTALMFAVNSKNLESVKLLLQAGADVNAKTKRSKTALMLAVEQDDIEIVEFLLKNNANRHIKDSSGKTAFDLAKKLGRSRLLDILRPSGR
jgi:hypothetical protein